MSQEQEFTSFRLELSQRVLSEHTVKQLGNFLGIPVYQVASILNQRRSDFPAAALEIFQKWLGRQSTTDYEELRQILRSVIEKNDGKLRLIHDFNEVEKEIYGTEPESVTVAQQETGGPPSRKPVQTSDHASSASPATTTIRIESSETGGTPPHRPVQTSDHASSASPATKTISVESSDSPESPGPFGDFGGAAAGDSEVDRTVIPARRPGFDDDEWQVPDFLPTKQYPIGKYKHLGRCVIINNEKFYSSTDRKGTDVDAEAIRRVMGKIGFKFNYLASAKPKANYFGNKKETLVVDSTNGDSSRTVEKSSDVKNVGSIDLRDMLTEVAKMEKDEYACFCLFFLTHGGENMLMYTADDIPISIRELTDFFKPKSCPGLSNKPKLFFIEACQGRSEDRGEQPDDIVGPKVIPLEADIFIFYAAPFGYKAWRHPTKGSRFIQCLCKALEKYYEEKELLEIATTVNNMVAQIQVKCGTKQVSMMTSTLRKPFYFTEKNK